jgi:MFS family permease
MATPLPIPRLKRIYYLITGLRWFAVALPLPLIYLFMGERGLDLFEIGVMSALYAVAIVALELPTGGLADAVGRKRVTLIAYAVSLISGVLMLFAFSFWPFALAWALAGVARALNSGALDAWFIDGLQAADPDVDLQPALAQAGSVEIGGLALGTLIGGALPSLFAQLPSGPDVLVSPLTTTLLASGAVQLIALALVALLVVEAPIEASDDGPTGLARVPQLVREAVELSARNPTIVLLLGAGALGAVALTAVEVYWQPHFGQWFDASDGSFLFGLLMTGAFAVGLIGNLVSTPLTRLFGGRYGRAAAAANLVAGLALASLALATIPVPAALLFVTVYLGIGLSGSPAATMLNLEIPAERRSSMLSVASLTGYLATALASLLFGLLAARSGVATVWLLAAALKLTAIALYLIVDRRHAAAAATDQGSDTPTPPPAGDASPTTPSGDP